MDQRQRLERRGQLQVDPVGVLEGQDRDPECGEFLYLAVRDLVLVKALDRVVERRPGRDREADVVETHSRGIEPVIGVGDGTQTEEHSVGLEDDPAVELLGACLLYTSPSPRD